MHYSFSQSQQLLPHPISLHSLHSNHSHREHCPGQRLLTTHRVSIMVLECTILILDNSQHSINGDYHRTTHPSPSLPLSTSH